MNWSKFFIAAIAAFVWIFGFGYVWWGLLMHSAHMEAPAMFRPEADFGNYMPWLILGHVIMAFFLTCIYASFVSPGSVGAGAKLGAKIGIFCAGIDFIGYAVHPMTSKMLWGWVAGDVIMLAIAGALIGALYKPSAPSAAV